METIVSVLTFAESKYIAASQASRLRKLLVGLFDQRLEATTTYYDNQSCIKLSENPVFHYRFKQIDIRYHLIEDHVQKRAVELRYISTDERVADIFMKSLMKGKFVFFKDKMGLVKNTFLTKREC